MEHKDEETIEEGEIVDDEIQYSPLQRPLNYSAAASNPRFARILEDSDSEKELQSSSPSDSDSDTQAYKAKKPKVKLKLKPNHGHKHKRYDVWSTRLQEEVLSETLNSCDVTKRDRSRDVETYDYSLSYSYENRISNKRSRDERNDKNLRLVNLKEDDNKKVKGKGRSILNLIVTEENSCAEIADDIANKLCEDKTDLINTIVAVAGKEKAMNIFKQVRKIEAEGGMLIMNQTRRRTPGGVFFFLIKHDNDLPADQYTEIFGDEKEKYKQEQKIKKKLKRQKQRAKIALEQTKSKQQLPELLTKAEQCVQELVSNNDRSRRETDDEDVVNPPPTPETDGQETSGDSMDQTNGENQDPRMLQKYDEDYLDVSIGNEMDMF